MIKLFIQIIKAYCSWKFSPIKSRYYLLKWEICGYFYFKRRQILRWISKQFWKVLVAHHVYTEKELQDLLITLEKKHLRYFIRHKIYCEFRHIYNSVDVPSYVWLEAPLTAIIVSKGSYAFSVKGNAIINILNAEVEN